MLAVAMASLLSLFVIFYFVVRAAGLENKTMRPFPIRCLGYNPLACSSEERWVDILQETQNFDFVMLAGTGIRYSGGEPASVRVDDRISISSGFRATNMSNRSCGVSIVLGKNFRNSRVDNICEAGGRIQGRGLAVRVRNPRADFTVCVCAISPRNRDEKLSFNCTRKRAGRLFLSWRKYWPKHHLHRRRLCTLMLTMELALHMKQASGVMWNLPVFPSWLHAESIYMEGQASKSEHYLNCISWSRSRHGRMLAAPIMAIHLTH